MRTIITKEILDYGTEVELTAPEKSSEDIGLKFEWVSTPLVLGYVVWQSTGGMIRLTAHVLA